jgi:hypothetical protein
MRMIFSLIGVVIAGAIASKLGFLIGGPVGAIMFSAIGGGVGLYYGRKLFDEYLGD